ncbi:alpha/beta fold hydrolase [Amycolatopsis sp. BJA-103]|uniref:alpha/beta fold hydrolase n=1 Tax=Amycolatopsis sp. BJA-103 TaxID=1911175 RepID=UPI000C783B85|nr:alpha/beta hydrolase [Amycolatopsis sp. BJA-103]AUI58734.1 alpha/beta hydrolase [Amycolatopsis sp. BJA-103]PNE16763.1 alpha/beta hydrolase [Amycolatopsis sp. BJA-103]
MPSGRIPVENGELAYELRGEGDPVILLHGGMLDSRMWDAEMTALEGRYTAIRYDARGHGESSTPTERFKHYEDLRALMTALELPRASLVGLSGGGRIAADFALTYPDLVENLVLVATGLSAMTTKDPFVLEQNKKLEEAGARGDLPAAIECVLRMWVDGPRRAPADVDPEIRRRCQEMYTHTITRHRGSGFILMDELRAIERVGELSPRTLTLVGDLDSSDILDIADQIEREAHDAREIVVPGVAHMVNLEKPAEFSRILLDFLDC